MMPEDVMILTHRPLVRNVLAALLREARYLPVDRQRWVSEWVESPPVLVDVASLFSHALPTMLMTLELAVVVGLRDDVDQIVATLREGIPVYIFQDLGPEALRHILYPASATTDLHARVSRLTAQRIREFVARRSARRPLTYQEGAVLGLLRYGYSNPQIAEALSVQIKTVKNHLTHIYAKLGVSTRYEAMLAEQPSSLPMGVSRLANS